MICVNFQENPEPFFMLAKNLYPGLFKVSGIAEVNGTHRARYIDFDSFVKYLAVVANA